MGNIISLASGRRDVRQSMRKIIEMKIMKFVNLIFERLPSFEVMARVVYWRSALFHGILKRNKAKQRNLPKPKVGAPTALPAEKTPSFDDLLTMIKAHGVKLGDILIVHSSFEALRKIEPNSRKIIEGLMAIVGPNGTLVMPAFPKYEVQEGTERMNADLSDVAWEYEPAKTKPWTGYLPYRLMHEEGAVRSAFPLNSIVALGAEAEAMCARELTRDDQTPNGPDSAWAYCAERDAIIIALGVDLAHNLTMIHTAEDCNESTWPVADWYRSRQFDILENGARRRVHIRERHPKWAINYGERRLGYDLNRFSVSKTTHLSYLEVTSLRSKTLIEFLQARQNTAYPYFLWRLVN